MASVRLVKKCPDDLIADMRERRAQSKARTYATTVHIYQNRNVPNLSAALMGPNRDDAMLSDMNCDYVTTIVLPGTARLSVVGGVAHDAAE